MNHDEGSYQLSQAYDHFLGIAVTHSLCQELEKIDFFFQQRSLIETETSS